MKEKIKELRSLRPIPIVEALQLLKDNDGDIETCVYLYTAKAIKEICAQTGCDNAKADFHYKNEKYDINRAISFIKDEIYDQSYTPIEGVNKESLQFIKDWIYVMETEDFGYSLSYIHLQKAIATLQLIPKLQNIAKQLQESKDVYQNIFQYYNDSEPLEVFVRLNKLLDDAPEFQQANHDIPLQVLYIKNEVSKHWRNT